MSASWNGRVRLAEADAKPGHYYVTVIDRHGRVAKALGPFTQRRPSKEAHAQALGFVRAVRRYCTAQTTESAWWKYGTIRIDLVGTPPVGKLNGELLP